MGSVFIGPGVHHGAGTLFFLTTGWCTEMMGIASALSLVFPLLVLTNWSALKCASRVSWVYVTHPTTQFCLPTYISHSGWMHSIREQFILPGNAYTTYISKRQLKTRDNFDNMNSCHISNWCHLSYFAKHHRSKSCWSQLMKFHNLSWGTKTTPHQGNFLSKPI